MTETRNAQLTFGQELPFNAQISLVRFVSEFVVQQFATANQCYILTLQDVHLSEAFSFTTHSNNFITCTLATKCRINECTRESIKSQKHSIKNT